MATSLPQTHANAPPGFGALDDLGDVRRQAFAAAQDADLDALAGQLVEVTVHIVLQQPHDLGDLAGRPAPILRREGIEGEPADAQVGGRLHNPANRLHALGVAQFARQPPALGPSAIAIHDDRHVQWRVLGGRLCGSGGHAFSVSSFGAVWTTKPA